MNEERNNPELPERITFRSVFDAVLGLFNLEKGLFYTYWVLTARPGQAIRKYIFEDRSKMSKPFGFLFFAVALGTYVTVTSIYNDQVMEQMNIKLPDKEEEARFMEQLFSSYFKYYNIYLLVYVPIVSFFTYLFFKKPRFYLAEHFVINSYLFSWQMLLYILLTPLLRMDFNLANTIYLIVSIAYSLYVYIRLFEYDWFEGGARGLLATMISYLIYMILLLVFLIFLTVYQLENGGLSG